ncbi:MAG: DUF4199 domain-containing protein [Psychroflexus sp.]
MKNFKTELKWAFIFIASMLIWMLLEKWFGLHDEYIHLHQYITMLYAIVAIAIYVLALRDKRKNYYKGKMTYKQGFKSGLIITIIITIFSPMTQWIISEVITPDYFENVITHSVETGYYKTTEEAESNFNLKTYVIQSTIYAFVMGIVTTSIVAVFTRKK